MEFLIFILSIKDNKINTLFTIRICVLYEFPYFVFKLIFMKCIKYNFIYLLQLNCKMAKVNELQKTFYIESFEG